MGSGNVDTYRAGHRRSTDRISGYIARISGYIAPSPATSWLTTRKTNRSECRSRISLGSSGIGNSFRCRGRGASCGPAK